MSVCCRITDSLAETVSRQPAEPPVKGGWGRFALAGLISAQSMAFGLAINLTPPEGLARIIIHAVLAFGAIFVFALTGVPLARRAIGEGLKGKVVFEQLFLLGILGAFGASVYSTVRGSGSVYYEVVAILLAIYTLGALLGDRRRKQVTDAARQLDREFSRCTRIDAAGNETVVQASAVAVGDRIRIRAGDGAAVDGCVVEGTAFVQEAALTGEPFPVVKRPGDTVFAGSRLIEDTLVIQATVAGSARKLDQLIGAVRAAQQNPSELQRQADRLTTWFLPVVAVVSLGTFGYWASRGLWDDALFNSLAVLLVACPCAMGLATPIGVWSALAAMARRGLVARSGEFVERLAQVDVVAFDKTGTLGEEALGIVDFVCVPESERESLRAEIAALQSASSHPVASAFHAWDRGALGATSLRVKPGVGVAGEVAEARLEIGNTGLLIRDDNAALETLRTLAAGAPFTHEVYIKRNGRLVALARLRERLREGVAPLLESIRDLGLEAQVWTGDRTEHANLHGLPGVKGGLAATEKAALVTELAAKGRRVLFVGDGINDTPALASAHASVAVADAAGLAVDCAGARLFGSRIETIGYALAVSRSTVRVIRQNLWFASAYNLVGVFLAATGRMHPAAAALIMLGASSTVMWRALREANRIDPERPDESLSNPQSTDHLSLPAAHHPVRVSP